MRSAPACIAAMLLVVSCESAQLRRPADLGTGGPRDAAPPDIGEPDVGLLDAGRLDATAPLDASAPMDASGDAIGDDANALDARDDVDEGADRDTGVGGRVTAIAAGAFSTCALREDGTVSCWGADLLERTTLRPPTRVAALDDAESLSAGFNHYCVVRAEGRVGCWGANDFLGRGSRAPSATPIEPIGLPRATAVSCGLFFTCALLADGALACWGDNAWGQIGDGTRDAHGVPHLLTSISDVRRIAAGGDHACAITRTDELRCWGRNQVGQLGDGSGLDRALPVSITALDLAPAGVSASYATTCVWSAEGDARCWGAGDTGQIGDGMTSTRTTPVRVSGLDDAVQVAVPRGQGHTCARRRDATVACWGANDRGQLGDGSNEMRTTPTPVVGLSDVVDIALGDRHTCALRATGEVLCWGGNDSAQIGDGTLDARATPTAVLGL